MSRDMPGYDTPRFISRMLRAGAVADDNELRDDARAARRRDDLDGSKPEQLVDVRFTRHELNFIMRAIATYSDDEERSKDEVASMGRWLVERFVAAMGGMP